MSYDEENLTGKYAFHLVFDRLVQEVGARSSFDTRMTETVARAERAETENHAYPVKAHRS